MNFYDLTFNDSRGNPVSMTQFREKTVLIVNTATKCGLAPQFEELEELHNKYKDSGLVVIGFPSNQFANQEPESNDSMAEACKINFGVTFLLSEKIAVNGEDTHPVFAYLKKNTRSGFTGKAIKWNFTKFLITPSGTPYKRYAPATTPLRIEKDIIKILGK